MGRPPIYTQELADRICSRLAAGESLRSICRDDDMPARITVQDWVIKDREGFASQYAHARDLGLDELADITLETAATPVEAEKTKTSTMGVEITTGDAVDRSRLHVDTLKWYLSKLAPKRYGEKASLELTGADGGPVRVDDGTAAAKLAGILEELRRRKNVDDCSDIT